MKIQILGSAAAEGWPALFCECDACKKARANGGKDIRRRCAYLIDDDTLVDFGPDIYAQSLLFNIDLANIRRIFMTHSHTDHLSQTEFTWRLKGFSSAKNLMRVFGNQAVLDKISSHKELQSPEAAKLALIPVNPGDSVKDDDIGATAVLADHARPPELPLNYIIQRNGVTALIGNDSGWWCDETWNALQNFKIDIAIIECTYGIKWPDQREKHLGANISVAVRDELQKRGILKDKALVAVNHFSHNCQNMHSDLEEFFNPKGILVGYDGMILEVK